MDISLSQAIHEANATLVYKKESTFLRLTGAASDNRLVKDGDIFVCIRGNTVDGHDFAKDAMERGAKALLAEYNPFEAEYGDNPPIPVLLVENSVQALGCMAHARRRAYGENFDHRVIGITGTAGKTSLKELIAHILSIDPITMEFNASFVAKNPYNHNTQIGMPLAILNASGDEKYWVLELGISHAHDMDELGAILQPDIAVILNVGSGHTEGLGDKGVAFHKARLLKYVQETGIAFVSKDYPELVKEADLHNHDEIIYFTALPENYTPEKLIQENHTNQNTKPNSNTQELAITKTNTHIDTIFKHVPNAYYLGVNTDGLGQYCINILEEEFIVCSPFLGSSGTENCLAASCVALALGISTDVIVYATANMAMPNMRFNRIICNNWDVIDDSYNANPLSSIRMIESAQELVHKENTKKAFYLCMGEMKELGDSAYAEHVHIATTIANSKVDILFWIGEQQNAIQEGLSHANFQGKFIPIDSPETFMTALEKAQKYLTQQYDKNLILFKGSRSNHLENYVKLFMEYCNAL